MAPTLGEFVAEPRLTTTESENWRGLIEATVPTLGVLNPSVSEIVDPNSTAGQALNYQAMFGVNAAGRVERNARLFGTAPELGGFLAFKDPLWESPAGTVPDKIALAKVDKPSQDISVRQRVIELYMLIPIELKQIARILGSLLPMVIVGSLYPLPILLVFVAIIVSAVISKSLAQRNLLALEKKVPPALPENSEQGEPYRSKAKNPIATLIREVLQPIDAASINKISSDFLDELFGKIELLGASLRDLDLLPAEFTEGLYALLQIWNTPLVVGNFIAEKLRKLPLFHFVLDMLLDDEGTWGPDISALKHLLRVKTLSALTLALNKENLNWSAPDSDYKKDLQFVSMAVKALQVLRQEMKRSNPVDAQRLLQTLSELLGMDDPEVIETRHAFEKAFPNYQEDKDDEEP